jgi:hypothetical protein
MLRALSVFLLAIASATPSIAAQIRYQMNCDHGKGTIQTQRSNGSTVILTPANGMCHVSVLDARQRTIFQYDAWGLQVFVGIGVTTDGSRNAVIQAETDTSVPIKLFVVSLGENPRLLRMIENQYGFWLQNDCGGRIRIWTADGAFQGYPDLIDVYHYDVFTPVVVFEIQGEVLIDATPECRLYFDKQIESLRSQLPENDINRFRTNEIADSFHRGEVKGWIVSLIFCYLYTDRETEAKQVLQRMWPSNDADRIWQSIVQHRSDGVLSQVNPR